MIARDGWSLILIGLVLTVVALWGCTRWNSMTLFIVSVIFGLATIFTVYFFRDPDRTVAFQPDMVVSPADGTITQIITLDNHPFVGDSAIQVSIFLSVFDVHVNRVPADGTIDYVNYIPGEFFKAYEDKASLKNEQTEIGMVSPSGQRLVFKQIAGIIARRIVCHLSAGDTVTAGERFGLIRFGSRADILFPAGASLNVKVGDHVAGGESIIGFFAPSQSTSDSTAVAQKDSDAGL